ncbi:MAG: diguanylate cyclase [Chlorobi bacterium OLB7]|nr:MAG: diguanylate cyclase [Chlorobi bacterium OLB7]
MVITLLGVAIALFLPDPIIKIIGGAVAVLGGLALYATIRQRMNDQVQIRQRSTTLPTPAFKTKVKTDPNSSTRRIVFDVDDFQEKFGPEDEPEPTREPSRPLVSSTERTSERTSNSPIGGRRSFGDDDDVNAGSFDVTPSVPSRPSRSFGDDGNDQEGEESGGESFRIIKPIRTAAPASQESPVAAATPAAAPVAASPTAAQPSAAVPELPSPEPIAAPEPPSPKPVATPEIEVAPAAPIAEPAQAPSVELPQKEQVADAVPLTGPVEEVQPERIPVRHQVQMMLDDFLASDGDEEGKGSEPRAEFVRLVAQTLNAVARSIEARSIVYFWVNLERGHVLPEATVTTGNVEVKTGTRFPIGTDIISQIARSGVPEIITDISPAAGRELIQYYARETDTRSFVGVPVFFRREAVGVLAADSNIENAFDEGSVATLAEYTRLISGLIRSYTEKFDLQLSARTLDAFEQMHRAFTGTSLTPEAVAKMLVDHVSQLFDSAYVACVLFDTERGEWRISAVHSDTLKWEVKALQPDMHGSLIGRATRFAEEVYIAQIGKETRFRMGEKLPVGGTFLTLPLVAAAKCYGALAIEHPAASAYIPRDVDILRDLVRYAAMAIEVYNANQAVESQSVFDEVTGLYNSDYLYSALTREVSRARDFATPLTLALITIDMPVSLQVKGQPELEETVYAHVGAMISRAIRPYDTAGRLPDGGFGVVLIGKNDQQAYLWGEKLRKEIAGRVITVGQRKLSVTISTGLCDLGDLEGADVVINGARQALDTARKGEGNAIVLY